MIATRCIQPVAVLFLLFALPGCQTDTSTTASGSPEIIVRGARSESVKPKIIGAALDLGMTFKNDTAIEVTVERPWETSTRSDVMPPLANLEGTPTAERLVFSVSDSGIGTRVVLDRYMVRTSRVGKEYVTPANNAPDAENLQNILDSIAPSLGSTNQAIDLPAVSASRPPPRISAPLTKLTTENLARR
jgi:hypothetical protein